MVQLLAPAQVNFKLKDDPVLWMLLGVVQCFLQSSGAIDTSPQKSTRIRSREVDTESGLLNLKGSLNGSSVIESRRRHLVTVCTLLCAELEHLKIETRLISEILASEMGEYVFLMCHARHEVVIVVDLHLIWWM